MLIVLIHNDGTGTERIGNYNVEVRINDHVIATGRIEDFDRRNGWRNLLLAVASERIEGVSYSVKEVNHATGTGNKPDKGRDRKRNRKD